MADDRPLARSATDAHGPRPCNATVVLEDLHIRSMTRSARGTTENPGTNVAQKAALNHSILDKGWYVFELALRSAARFTGTVIIKVPAAYTSQTCSRCRNVNPESRESQAVFRCINCGHNEHADINAAKNIMAAGPAVTACGDLGVTRSEKQEPQPGPAGIPTGMWGGGQVLPPADRRGPCGAPHPTVRISLGQVSITSCE
ncbi:RNA-guided endonuclease InsQ/TnpB family protein [Nocardia sp. NPDC020380]|uniref:RNA-guided endonuclease InsQ/TnpB family protein n=1 Tax=Nocardia sp. NPDC020380 TaxID=3364309 RepID=UPI0037B23EBD